MLQGPIKELFYSNGIDVFGPVDMDEFCKNRYYKSTMVWYEGLAGWVNIGDCEELRHLIGTLHTENGVPHALPSSTPPLEKKLNISSRGNLKYMATIAALLLILAILLLYTLKLGSEDNESLNPLASNDSISIPESSVLENAAAEAEKKTYRLNWEKFVLPVTNDFRVKEIGGIDDLKIKLKNNSPYVLDSVKVKVNYVKANGESFQTEMLRYDLVAANSEKELFAPRSSRGVKVLCSIVSLYSREMQICLDKQIDSAKTGEDPYFCE